MTLNVECRMTLVGNGGAQRERRSPCDLTSQPWTAQLWPFSWEIKLNVYPLKPLCAMDRNHLDSASPFPSLPVLFDTSLRFTVTKFYSCGTRAPHFLYPRSFFLVWFSPQLLPRIHSPNLQWLILLLIRPMGIFQPAFLSTAVWQDFLPCRLFQVMSASDAFTTATA